LADFNKILALLDRFL